MTRMSLPTPTLHTARLRLRPFDDADADIMEIFRSFESNIKGIARRLVAAGVAGTPLVMRPETFSSPHTR